jgi:hypothetical protein
VGLLCPSSIRRENLDVRTQVCTACERRTEQGIISDVDDIKVRCFLQESGDHVNGEERCNLTFQIRT